ncbi:MAG: methyltransferase domain-containing protein [Peptostreptococcaceae bacterium]|nr:methyltransferase domain-containing protein [Peptostreptococcaceae bacterium]
MFWDKVAFIYDLFADLYNGKTHAILCRKIESLIEPEDDVLECACGTGMLTVRIAPRCRSMVATDLSPNMLKKAQKKCRMYDDLTFEQSNILHLKHPSERFDKVVAANVIHLLDDPYQALRELDRVCKVGGKMIIPTYIQKNDKNSDLMEKTVGKAGANFKRRFTIESYRDFFAEAGYENVEFFVADGRVACAVAVITKNKKS